MKQTLRLVLTFCLLAFIAGDAAAQRIVRKSFARAERQTALLDSLLTSPDLFPASWNTDGTIKTNSARGWISGFFPANIWFLYEYTRDPKWLDMARRRTAPLDTLRRYTKTHDLGFMVGCPCAAAYRLTGEEAYRQLLIDASDALLTRFSPAVGLIRPWDNKNGDPNPYRVIIDNMMNLELLMWAADRSGDKSLRDMAVSHADKTLKHHFRPDFSSCHLVSYDTISGQPHLKQTHQGLSDSSAWSRGQAWGLYGYTCMYRLTGDARYLEQARGIAGFLINHRNMPADGIPYWDFDAPALASTPRDASAAAIMASALVELSGFVPAAEGERYMAFAEKQIRTLASPEYTAPAGENGGFILRHSTGAYPFSSEVDVPLTYADYYYLEALTRIKRRLQP